MFEQRTKVIRHFYKSLFQIISVLRQTSLFFQTTHYPVLHFAVYPLYSTF